MFKLKTSVLSYCIASLGKMGFFLEDICIRTLWVLVLLNKRNVGLKRTVIASTSVLRAL